jgi:hypothetical protein
MLRVEDDFVHLHLVKHDICVDCIRHWHGVVKHEPMKRQLSSCLASATSLSATPDLLYILLMLREQVKGFGED